MEQQIRILHVLGRLDRGGAETMIMNLYRHMDRGRFQFDFVIHTEDVCDYTEEVKRLGGNIYSMKPFRASTAPFYRRQWRIFFREHPEYLIVHGHMRSTASLYLQEAKKAGRITIIHSHNTSSGRGVSALVKNILQYPLRFQADYLFACSNWAGIWLYGKRACKKQTFCLLKNGIEPGAFSYDRLLRQEMRRAENIPEKSLVFFHVGRLEPQKNHRFLLEIFAELHKKRQDTLLLLCGVGPLEKELQQQVREKGLSECVRFLGMRTDIPALLQAADGMIFPSLFEGLPVTLVEAQAAGLPVLMSDTVTDEVALTELVESLPLTASATQWAERALLMLQKGRERTGYAQQIAAAGYDVEENARWLSQFYETTVKNGIREI